MKTRLYDHSRCEWKYMSDIECCATCRHCYDLERLDYSKGGCKHEKMDGYICMVFAGEGTAMWMIGANPETEMCEGYKARRENDGRI